MAQVFNAEVRFSTGGRFQVPQGATPPTSGTRKEGELFWDTDDDSLLIGVDTTTFRTMADLESAQSFSGDKTFTGALIATSGSMRIPNGTSIPGAGTEGDMFWKTDTDTLYVHDGTTFTAVTAGGGAGVTSITGGDGITASASTGAVTLSADLATAGAGTGGLTITSGQIEVDPGDGIELTASGVAVNLSTTSGLEFATGELQVNAGTGLTLDGSGTSIDTATGSVTFTGGTWTFPADSLQINSDPDSANDAVRKSYVDSLVSSQFWEDPVATVGLLGNVETIGLVGQATIATLNGLSPSAGDAYIATDAGTPTAGTSDALVAGSIAEFDGTSWIELVAGSGGFVPNGTYAILSTATALISPYTDVTDDGKIVAFAGSDNTGTLQTQATGDAVVVDGTTKAGVNEGSLREWSGSAWVEIVAPSSSLPPSGTRAAISTSSVIFSPYTDATDDGKIVEFDGASMTGTAQSEAVDGHVIGVNADGAVNEHQLYMFNGTVPTGSWTQLTGANGLSAGNGISISSNTVSAVLETAGVGTGGLAFDNGEIRVDAGDGIVLTADGVEVDIETAGAGTGGLELTATGGSGQLAVLAGDGIELTASGVAVNLEATGAGTGGLAFDAGELRVDVGTGMILDANGVSIDQATGSVTFTGGTWSFPVDVLQVTGTPNTANDAVNKSYVDSVATGLQWVTPASTKDYLGTRTITEINALSPTSGQTVVAGDGGTPTAGSSDLLAAGDVAEFDGTQWKKIVSNSGGFVPDGTRLLVHTETITLYSPLTDGTDEGKYADFDGTTNTPTLTSPSDGDAILISGNNSVNEFNGYTYDTGTTDWVQFTGAGQINAGTGLSKSGNTLNVGDAGKGVQVNATDLEVDASELVGSGYGLIEMDTEAAGNSWQLAVDLDGTLRSAAGTNDVNNNPIYRDATGLNIKVDNSTIGLEAGSGYRLYVPAQGITEAELHTSVAGDGLNGGNGTALSVDAGDGLQIGGAVGGATALNIDVADFAGTGLKDDGSENLTIDNANGAAVTFSGTTVWTFGPDNLQVSGTPDSGNDAVNKTYVDTEVAALFWEDPVTTVNLIGNATIATLNGLSPSPGDAYIATDAGTPTAGSSDALVAGSIAEFDGTSWIELVAGSGGFVPSGTRVALSTSVALVSPYTDATDDGKIYVFDGTDNTGTVVSGEAVDGHMIAVSEASSQDNEKLYMFNGSVATGTWNRVNLKQVEASFTSQTSVTVQHNLNNQYVTVQVYNGTDTIQPDTVTRNANSTVVTFASAQTGVIVIVG